MSEILVGKPEGVRAEGRNVHDPDNYTVSWPTGRHRLLAKKSDIHTAGHGEAVLQEEWFTKGMRGGHAIEPTWTWRDVETVIE
jgi:hypothetical protein